MWYFETEPSSFDTNVILKCLWNGNFYCIMWKNFWNCNTSSFVLLRSNVLLMRYFSLNFLFCSLSMSPIAWVAVEYHSYLSSMGKILEMLTWYVGCRLRTNMSGPLIVYLVPSKENNFIIYFLMPHYAKCDVISGQNKKLKLKYLVNKTLERKSIKELVLQF